MHPHGYLEVFLPPLDLKTLRHQNFLPEPQQYIVLCAVSLVPLLETELQLHSLALTPYDAQECPHKPYPSCHSCLGFVQRLWVGDIRGHRVEPWGRGVPGQVGACESMKASQCEIIWDHEEVVFEDKKICTYRGRIYR